LSSLGWYNLQYKIFLIGAKHEQFPRNNFRAPRLPAPDAQPALLRKALPAGAGYDGQANKFQTSNRKF